MNAQELRRVLAGGDRRSIGPADRIASIVTQKPDLFGDVMQLVTDEDPVVRMLAADVAEKASRSQPKLLADYKSTLLERVTKIDQHEVQWHLLPMLSRLPLTDRERALAFAFAVRCTNSLSRIVAVEGLSAMFALADTDTDMHAQAADAAARALEAPSPALRARARKLLSGR